MASVPPLIEPAGHRGSGVFTVWAALSNLLLSSVVTRVRAAALPYSNCSLRVNGNVAATVQSPKSFQ